MDYFLYILALKNNWSFQIEICEFILTSASMRRRPMRNCALGVEVSMIILLPCVDCDHSFSGGFPMCVWPLSRYSRTSPSQDAIATETSIPPKKYAHS